MNLLERIDRRLADMRARIDPNEFEDCVTSLLTPLYPGLVPIVGGTDYGLDAEVTSSDSRLIGLTITSSRTPDGARASLRSSLASMRRHGLQVERVMAANLAEMNRRRRNGLSAIAHEFDCELVQVFDRAFFANQFRAHPDWRRRILGIAGGAFSLSREPRGSWPVDRHLPTIGRDQLLAELINSEEDLVLHGVPGSGKSHVAALLPEALFLDDQPSSERLLDDLISAHPAMVIVDDAGGRFDELDRLVYARRAENLSYRVVATCWPHQVDDILDHVPGAHSFEVELLTREEMGNLLRSRGITRLAVLARILEMAQGRPAWALNLADLLIRDGDWRSVWTGAAVRSQVLGYLRRSGASPAAIDLLAAIAMLGQVGEDQVRRLGRLLEIPRVDLRHAIDSVAVAGLLDVERVRTWLPQGSPGAALFEDRYKVEPEIVAASIAADSFFAGRAPTVSLHELRNEFTEKAAHLVQTQIHCALVGANEPILPTRQELADALAVAENDDEDAELLRSYASLGRDQARFVSELLMERARTSMAAGDSRSTQRSAKMLAERVANRVKDGEAVEPVLLLLGLLSELAENGFFDRKIVEAFVEELRGARTGDLPDVTHLLSVAEALTFLPEPPSRQHSLSATLALALALLQPTFEDNYMSPEVMNQFILRSFTWPGRDLIALFEAVRPELERILPDIIDEDLKSVLTQLRKWVSLGEAYALPFGGQPTDEQAEAASRIAAQFAGIVEQAIQRPGLRAQFNAITRPLGIHLDEPDTLFATVTADRDFNEGWREAARRSEQSINIALAPYLRQPPNVIMRWIAANQEDLELAREHSGAIGRIMRRIADEPDATRWLTAALEAGLNGQCGILIDAAVSQGGIDPATVTTLLGDPATRPALLDAVLRNEADPELAQRVISQATATDLAGRDLAIDLRHASEPKLTLLFTHPDPNFRGTAAALWAAGAAMDTTPDQVAREVPPHWIDAVKDFTVPSVLEDFYQREALKAIAREAPDIYTDLLTRHAQAAARHDDFDEWSDSLRELDPDQRRRLWSRIADTRNANELFWALAAGSVEWIESVLDGGAARVGPDRLLQAWRCQNGPGISFTDIARLFMPLGVEPDGLLWLLETGTHFGEDHQRHAASLDQCRALAASADDNLARLGIRGMEVYERRLAEAQRRARNAAVRGRLA